MTHVPAHLRQAVRQRAQGCCGFVAHEIDHIFAEKHGGETVENNLCLCCLKCNRHKGSDLSSLDDTTGEIVPLFHPRRDKWSEHFDLSGGVILAKTGKGRVTIKLLRLNTPERTRLRIRLIGIGRYPCPAANT